MVSSESTKAIHSPSAASSPALRAPLRPRFFWWMTRMRLSLCRCGIAQKQGTAVRRAIVHQDQLKIREGLGKDGRDAGAQKTLCLIYRHDDADLRLFFMLFLHNKLLIASGRFLPSFRPFAHRFKDNCRPMQRRPLPPTNFLVLRRGLASADGGLYAHTQRLPSSGGLRSSGVRCSQMSHGSQNRAIRLHTKASRMPFWYNIKQAVPCFHPVQCFQGSLAVHGTADNDAAVT